MNKSTATPAFIRADYAFDWTPVGMLYFNGTPVSISRPLIRPDDFRTFLLVSTETTVRGDVGAQVIGMMFRVAIDSEQTDMEVMEMCRQISEEVVTLDLLSRYPKLDVRSRVSSSAQATRGRQPQSSHAFNTCLTSKQVTEWHINLFDRVPA